MINNPGDYILSAGCSHTDCALSYIDPKDFWINQVGKKLNLRVVNLAKGGACASYVNQQIQNWLSTYDQPPSLIIVQWPNPFRSQEVDIRTNNIVFAMSIVKVRDLVTVCARIRKVFGKNGKHP